MQYDGYELEENERKKIANLRATIHLRGVYGRSPSWIRATPSLFLLHVIPQLGSVLRNSKEAEGDDGQR